jgi:hypothetical protein
MEERELDLRPLRPPIGNHRPVAGKAKGQFAGDRHDFLRQAAFSGDFQQALEKEGFVRGRAFGSVDVQVVEFIKQVWHRIALLFQLVILEA